jgi:glutamate synthase (NADPH/NADH) small chain
LSRKDPAKRSAHDRIADFLEIYGFYDEVEAREQASRCVQCPEPTCVAGCPLGANIPEWLALTAEGRFAEAAAALHSGGNLPEICARVCPADHLCEAQCLINGQAQPVSIWAVEQFLNEYAFSHGIVKPSVAPPNGRHVAIAGAGPGGLACADGLIRRGFAVTAFDRRMLPGGMLVYGTPEFHLERSIVQRRVELLRQQGVVFELGTPYAEETALADLLQRFDAVYLAFGAKAPRTLVLSGADLDGVHQAVPFLFQAGVEHPGSKSLVGGRRVVVIGGGDTAIDCARMAVRRGAAATTVVYRRDEGSMPCMRRDYDAAVEEGVSFILQATPVEILRQPDGSVAGLQLARTSLGAPDADGRRPFKLHAKDNYIVAADVVFLALGFDPAPPPLSSPSRVLASDDHGEIRINARQMTSLPGVFAGGDLVRGPCTALAAVRDARLAVEGIEAYVSTVKPLG